MRHVARRLQMLLVLGLLVATVVGIYAQEPTQTPAPETTATPDLAVLIVGDESNPQMKKFETALIQEMGRLLKKWGDKKPPIFSYHFDKKRERSYCEQKLNILKEDLVFVGIVELDKKVPRKVVYRIDRLVNPTRSANEVLTRTQEMLGIELAASSPSASPTASPSASPSASASEQPGSWKIQMGRFAQQKNADELVGKLREKGHVAVIQRVEEGGATLYKVFLGPFANRQEVLSTIDTLKQEGFTEAFAVEVPGDN